MSVEEADKLQLFWDHFFRAETGTYEKSTWLDLFLAEFLIRVHDGADPKKLINFCPISGVVSLVGCELLCGIHRVTSAINAHYTPLPLTADLGSSGDVELKEPDAEEQRDDAGVSKVSGLFSKANAQSSVEILRKYLLSGVAWRCLVLLKVLGVEGVSCCRQLSSVLQWVCGEVGGGGGEGAPPSPYLPAPTPAHNITEMLSNRIWSKHRLISSKTPLSPERGSVTPSRKRNTQTKSELLDSKRTGNKDDDSSDSQVSASATDLHVLNKTISIKVQPNDDFVYFDSLVRTPEDTTSFYSDHSTPKRTKPKPDDYTTEKHKEIINSHISSFEFTIIIIDLLKELCKAESSLSGSEGSQISVQCINFSLRNLCSLQFGSSPSSSKSYTAKELSKIKVALTELLIVSLDKVLVRVDLCAKLITNGILPMLLRLLEDIVYKFKFNKGDNDLENKDKEQAEELLRYVFGIAYSIIAFFHCLLMQCRSVEKLKEFTEQFKLYGDCLKGGCLRECIEVMVRIPHVQSEGVVLVKRLIEVLGKLVWSMKVCRSEVIHSAACGRTRHKTCRARVRAGLHHHHDILGESSLTPSTSSPCSISILLNTLCFLLTDEELSSHNTLRVKILRVFLSSGVCCCFSPAVLMENIVRSMLTHPVTANLCLRVLEHTVYGELGASVLLQKNVEDRLPCQVCQPDDAYLRDFKKPYGGSDRKNFCSFLIHYNSLLQLDNPSSVLHATVSHIHRVTPKCRSEVMYELLFSVMYPTFIVAKHRYIIRMEESAYFLTASCLDIFANLLNTVSFAEQFIQRGGLSYVLELVSLNEFSKQCCSILEIAIIVEIHKVTKECPDLSYYQDLSSLSSVQMLLDSLTVATDKCIDVFRVRMSKEVFEELTDVSREIDELDLPSLGFERSRSVSSPVNIKRDSEKYAEETVEGFLEILSRCGRVWRAAAWVALCSPGFRRLAATALLPSSFRLLKLLLGCWTMPGDRLAPREFAPLEAVLTIHAACDDVTNGRSKAISCRIIQNAIDNCSLVKSVKDTELDNDWADDYKENYVQSKEEHVQNEPNNVQNETNYVQNEVNNVSKRKSRAKVVVNDETECNALRVICETLIKVSMRSASSTEVLPPRSPTKALSTVCGEGASSGSEARSSSESGPEPYASELSDSLTRKTNGYEADIEMGRLEQLSISRSRRTSASSTPVHCPPLHSGLRSASWSATGGAAHPEYCARALTLLAALVRRALQSGMDPWGNLAMRVCNRFPTAPLVGSLLYSVRPLFVVQDDTFLELQRCVLEVFHRLASWRLEAADLRAFLRLFLHDRVAPRPLLTALHRLANASPRYLPHTALEFPLSMHNNDGPPPDNPTVNKNSQAEIVVKRYREQHLQAGITSSWSRYACHGALGAGGSGGSGWAPWLQGFGLHLALYRPPPVVEASDDEWSDLEPKTAESPRKKLGPKRVIEDSEREWSHVVSVGHEALMFEIWMQASTGTLSLRLTRPEANKPLSSATVDVGRGNSIAAQLSELHNKRKLYIQATIYVDGCQMETVLLPLPGILVRKASASLVLLGDTISCSQSSIADQWQLASCSIYRGLALTTAAVLHRAAIGPSAPPHLNCLVDKPIPNFGAVMTPDLLESNVDWDQLFESSERAAMQMDEKLIWHYTAHHPYRAFFYTNSTPLGCAVPERVCVWWRVAPRPRTAPTLTAALPALGGADVFTGLAARCCLYHSRKVYVLFYNLLKGSADYAAASFMTRILNPSHYFESVFRCSRDEISYPSSTIWYDVNCTWADAIAWGCNSTANLTLSNSTNSTNSTDSEQRSMLVMAVTSVSLALIILATIIGNVFVIAAIIIERNLQNVANYLVASLAVADLMVACLVMPLGAVYEVSQGWILGPELCDMWTSSDVLCSSASILHLVAIATDRYWAVTNVDYIHMRNERRIFTMIFLVWGAALVVSLAPQLGWKDPDYLERINQQKCLVSQDLAYQIFATCSTFYVPLAVILILYWKIFQTARKRIRRRRDVPLPRPSSADGATPSGRPIQHARDRRFIKKRFLNLKKCNQRARTETLAASLLLTEGQSTSTVDTLDEEPKTTAFTINERVASVSPEKSSSTATNGSKHEKPIVPVPTHKEKKESLEAKRERKAAKTLAIITGAFVICWLPFFIMALVMPICQTCVISDYLASFFLWLGYFNSTLNPVIYTIFSPDFRQAFARILFGTRRRGRNKKF